MKIIRNKESINYLKKVMEKKEVTMRDGEEKKRHCVELQICGIKPSSVSETEMETEEYDDEDEIDGETGQRHLGIEFRV